MSFRITRGVDVNIQLLYKKILLVLDEKKAKYYEEDTASTLAVFKYKFGRKPDDFDIKLMDDFVYISKRYVSINVEESEKIVCEKCGKFCDCKKKTNRSDYEDEENFLKALSRFECKQIKNLEMNTLFEDLDEYFDSYSMPVSKDILKLDINEDGITRGNTSLDMLIESLSAIARTDVFEDIYLICSRYWGWTFPDISEYRESIVKDYRTTQRYYLSMYKSRKSCLNLQYRIFKHLEIYIPVKKNHFKLPSTPEILKDHDRLWKEMCKYSGITFNPTI